MLHFRQTSGPRTSQQTRPQQGAMQRATANTGRWVGALALLPALVFSHFVSAADRGTGDHAGSESVLNRWHDYALASITPQFSWAAQPASNAPPRVLDRYGEHLDMPPLFTMSDKSSTRVALAMASGVVSDTPAILPDSTPSM